MYVTNLSHTKNDEDCWKKHYNNKMKGTNEQNKDS